MSSPAGSLSVDNDKIGSKSKLEPSSAPQVDAVSAEPQATVKLSFIRKSILLVVFCFAQFLDVFNFAANIVAIPSITRDVGVSPQNTVWIVSAFQLTFAAFLLMSGRISDVWDPKHCFLAGTISLGALSIGCGFVRNEIGLFVLRALSGISASLTIPSAFSLIIRFFPEPGEQGVAIGAFGGSGALGTTLGVIIGAVLVQFASWPWVFWFSAIVAFLLAIACAILVPSQHLSRKKVNIYTLDVVGVFLLTTALILFIFAMTSSSNVGWGTGEVLAPLIISIFLVAGFLYWETIISEENAALPPRMWFYPNFAVLIGIALSPYMFWTVAYLLFTSLFQDVFGWDAIKTGVHFLPIGIPGLPVMMIAGFLLSRLPTPKYIIIVGGIFGIVGTALLPFAGHEDHYWRITFPGFLFGTMSATIMFIGANVAIFQATPPMYAGTVGAIFNSALQLGSAAGSAVISTIQGNIDAKPSDDPFKGRSAGLWFLFAVLVCETVAVVVFYRAKPPADPPAEER